MSGKAPVFDKIIQDYLREVSGIEAREKVATALGITVIADGYRIPFFQKSYRVVRDRISDADGKAVHHAVAVLLCKYLLLCPEMPSHDTSLATYKDFRDAAPYVYGFRNTAEQPIADRFTRDLSRLSTRCLELGGQIADTEVSCDLAIRFQALPKIPVLLLFNDADDDFPAQATILFQKDAACYLDMECLAMVGGILAYRLGKQ